MARGSRGLAARGALLAFALTACAHAAQESCPFSSVSGGGPSMPHTRPSSRGQPFEYPRPYDGPLADFAAVEKDLLLLMTDSQEFWPADYGHYGGFFIRLAWHCSGSYRTSDGRGGCDGGRIRHLPEFDWHDSANLDKALALLQPIKLKYGPGLSWSDLIVLSGTVAIKSMGGPVLGFCGGRSDDSDGSASLKLGPSAAQEATGPCPDPDFCRHPLGPTEIGLIYVNPEGPGGKPDAAGSAVHIRSSFTRMGMNDTETVALIGAHTVGKNHGACPDGPGDGPKKNPVHPYKGTCGEGKLQGKGPNTFTSGLEGKWTMEPTVWSNEYFRNLLDYTWTNAQSPGGGEQFGTDENKEIMMLTTDVALLKDAKYAAIVREYAADTEAFNHMFSHTWYKLTSQDMGPHTRCRGDSVPPPQPFQNPLPDESVTRAAAIEPVRAKLTALLEQETRTVAADALPSGGAYYGALFSTLAYQCASTYRSTSFLGGCDGARIRFAPESEFVDNVGLDSVLAVLQDAKRDDISWADLIVLAGQVALEAAGGEAMPFCPGRRDATNGVGRETMLPRTYYSDDLVAVRDNMEIMGLTPVEMVALSARLRSPTHQGRLGFKGSFSEDPRQLSNAYFQMLLAEEWEPTESVSDGVPPAGTEYKARGRDVYVTSADLALVWDTEYKAIVQRFATEEGDFRAAFAAAWNKLMNADRFDGPNTMTCEIGSAAQ